MDLPPADNVIPKQDEKDMSCKYPNYANKMCEDITDSTFILWKHGCQNGNQLNRPKEVVLWLKISLAFTLHLSYSSNNKMHHNFRKFSGKLKFPVEQGSYFYEN